jgi:hypothetical protein
MVGDVHIDLGKQTRSQTGNRNWKNGFHETYTHEGNLEKCY